MKKLFLLLPALVLSLAANAQKVEFRLDGKTLQDGATATFQGVEDDWGTVSINTNPNSDPYLLVIHQEDDDDFTEEASATMEIEENTLGVAPAFCLGGSCVPIMGYQLTNDFTFTDYSGLPVNDVKVEYDVFLETGSYGHILSKCTVNVGSASSYIYIDFVYSDPAGIKDVNKADNTAEIGRYTADGQLISAPMKGLNIVKLANGKTIKQMVK